MSENVESDNKKVFWKQWWFWAVVVVLLIIGMFGSQSGSRQNPESTSASTASSVSTSSPGVSSADSSSTGDQDPMALLDTIAQNAGMQVTEAASFKPDEEYSQNGPYKRAEYRLDAYRGSAGAHALLDGVPVDVVAYHQMDSHSVRIYAEGAESVVLQIYSSAAHAFDSSLSDSDVQSAVAQYQSAEVKDGRDLLSGLPSNKSITSDYIIGSGDNCEIFIDAKP
ncbi:hypothetical protein ACLUWO_04730 [Pseudoscardovia radai]|uniref:hypothetical protein n=1 Tax=Pseudoscardovia TaxID=1302778 RepID=UPI0039926940